ncbi:MAG TPA: glycosyltransferase family 39 protein [Pirellulales bacterium]|nr:glycosyltransferase family 39 protein [Pirellulales bacterium]
MTNDCDRRLLGVLGLAFVLRGALPLAALAVTWPGPPLVREPDSAGYVRLAEALVATGHFTEFGRPEIERTPGYVCFLVPGVLTGHIDAVTIALQCAVGCLTVYLTYRLALQVFERPSVALAGALLCACEPLSVLYAGKLLTETTFTCAVAAVLLLLARHLRWGGWCDLLGSALMLALAIFIRPIALYLPFVLGLLIVAGFRPHTPRRRRLGEAAAFIALAAGLPCAWIARNHIVAQYDGFSAMGDVNLYFWHAAGVEAARQGRPLRDVQREWGYFSEQVFQRRNPAARRGTAAQHYAFLRREAWRILLTSPGTTLVVYLDGIRDTLVDPGTQAFRDYFREHQAPVEEPARAPAGAWARLRRALATKPLVVAIHGALQVTVLGYLVLALLGCLSKGNGRRMPVVLLVVTLGYFLLLSGGPTGYHRFRLPILPMLSLLAGAGGAALWSRRPTGTENRRSAAESPA